MTSLNPYAASNPDYQAQQLDLARRQAMAQALTQQGLAPIDYDNRGKISPWQGVNKLAAALMGGYMGNQNIADAAQLNAYGNKLLQRDGFNIGVDSAEDAPQISNAPPRSAGSHGYASTQPQVVGGSGGAGPSPQALAAALSPGVASQTALSQGAQQGSVGPTVANGARMDALMAQPQPQPAPQPQSQPAAGMGSEVFVQAATRAGLPTDNGTLNQIVGLVNQGQSPDAAAATIRSGGQSAAPASGTGYPGAPASYPAPGQQPGAGRNSAPLVMPGLTPQQSFMAYQLMGPEGYAKALVERSDSRTDFSKTLLAMGIDPSSPTGRQLMGAQAAKLNYIAPVEMRPGGGLMDARTGAVTTMPAAAPAGFQSVQLADGSWGMVPVRGGTDAITQSTAAGEAGKAPFQIIDTYSNGKPGKNYAGNVLSIPGVGNSPSQPSQATSGAPASFDLGGTPQQQAAILADIARRGPTPEVRAAATQRLQAMQSGAPGGGANGVQTGPGIGEAQGATNAQDELSKTWAQQQQAHAAAQTNVGLLQSVKGLADKAITGYEPDRRMLLAQLGAYVGMPGQIDSATSTDLMNKYSAQLIGSLSQKGMDTDSARAIVQAGTPGVHMQPQAIRDAVDGLIAREQMTQARTVALQPYAINRDPAGFQNAATRFDAVADPRLWQMRSMSPQQLQAFTAKMPAGDARQLMQKYQAASQMGAFQ